MNGPSNAAHPPRILFVWTFFVARGLFMILLVPLWGGFDEWLHYGYAAYLSRTGKAPVGVEPSIPKEIHDSLKIAPGDGYEMGQPGFPEFWSLPESERSAVLSGLRGLTNERQSEYTVSNWQAQHPPLYYAALSPFYLLLEGKSLASSVKILRVLSLLIASLALFPFYALLKMFFDEKTALLGLVLLACFPSTYILFGHLTNDCLAFPIFTAIVYLTLRQWREGLTSRASVGLGALTGLGIITKLYFLTVLPVLSFVYLWTFLEGKGERPAILRNFLVFASVAAAICAFWFLKNVQVYGTWNPTVHAVASKNLGLMEKLGFLGLVDWKSFAFSNLIGLLWAGNWSFVTFPAWIYKTFALALAGGGALFIAAFLKRRENKRDLSAAALAAGFSAAFLLGMAYHQLLNRVASNFDSMGGWYWTVLLPVHIFLLMFALRDSLGRFFKPALAATIFASYVLSQWGTAGMLLPYYTGLLEKSQIAGTLFNAFPMGESLQRIAQLNSLPQALLPALLGIELGTAYLIGKNAVK